MKKKLAPPSLDWEKKAGYPALPVAGVDEVGRGCLAGPVVAAAAIFPDVVDYDANPWLLEVTDSKRLDAEKRARLAPLIQDWVKSYAVGVASVEEIDRINIHHASHLAMVRAVDALVVKASHILVDGKFVPKDFQGRSTAIIKGDLSCLSIACASIIAKVWRDSRMGELEAAYPGYGFLVHKGYPTPFHLAAIRKIGISDIHRRSFALLGKSANKAKTKPKSKTQRAARAVQTTLFDDINPNQDFKP